MPSTNGGSTLESLLYDVRYAARSLLRARTHTLVALATLALGLGGTTAMFAVVDAVLLAPLPYRDPDQLVVVSQEDARLGLNDAPLTYQTLERLEGGSHTVSAWAGISTTWNFLVATRNGPERTPGAFVSTSLFEIIGVHPLLGRGFVPEDGKHDAEPVALVSHRFWQAHFGGSPDVVGKMLSVGGTFQVVGVMPAGFRVFEDVDVWAPLETHPWASTPSSRPFLKLLGRLAPGSTVDEASVEIAALGHANENDTNLSLGLRSLHEEIVGASRPAVLLLLGAVVLVLLIACANVATLLLSRYASRERELAIRVALGAGRGRLIRHVLAESMLLAISGGCVGLLVASRAIALLPALGFGNLPRQETIAVDVRAFGFALAAALAAAAACSVMPLFFTLRAGGRVPLPQTRATERLQGRRFRSALALVEMALAASLLFSAGLLIRSFTNLMRVDLGFSPERLLTLQLSSDLEDPAARVGFYRELFDRIEALPGVVSVGAATRLPLRDGASARVEVDARPVPEAEWPTLEVRRASEGYFRAMGIRLVRGRTFAAEDDFDAAPVAVVSRAAARALWSGEDPIGKRFRIRSPQPERSASASESRSERGGGAPRTDRRSPELNPSGVGPRRNDQKPNGVWLTVVGVVGDVKHFGLDSEARPEVYMSFDQGPPFGPLVAIRTSSDPRSVIPAVREQIRAMDREMGVFGFATMDELLTSSVARRRFVMRLVTVFSGTALLLAAVGIYGVFSSLVLERSREMCVRVALGAERRDVLRLVMGQGLGLALIGVALGVAGALGLGRTLSSFLFGVRMLDPGTIGLAALLIVATALGASLLPALAATRVDPVAVLKEE